MSVNDRTRTKPAMTAGRFALCFIILFGFFTIDTVFGEPVRCDPLSEFQCLSQPSLCIPVDRVRDGRPDCPDQSDEECSKSEFRCKDDSNCIPEQWVQDGWDDCPDGSDEECEIDQHRCGCGELRCVDKDRIKDGVQDCLDGSDEDDDVKECPNLQDHKRPKRQTSGAQEFPRRRKVRVRPEATPTQNGNTEDGDRIQDGEFVPYEQSANFKFLRLSGRNGQPEQDVASDAVESPIYDGTTSGQRRSVLRRVRPTNTPVARSRGAEQPTRSGVIRRTRTRQHHREEATELPTEPPTTPAPSSTEDDYEPEPTPDVTNDHIDDSDRRGPSPVRRVIRLRRPEAASSSNQRKKVLVSRRLVNGQVASTLQARGPVSETDNLLDDQVSTVDNEAYTTDAVPVTYLTTYTYYTTFLHGINTVYTSREATVSTVATQTINPDTAKVIQSYGGYTSDPKGESIIHLGSRVFGPTTTVVNLASRIQLFNDDVYSGVLNTAPLEEATPTRVYSSSVVKEPEGLYQTRHASDLKVLPKTYYTLYTYYYTFYDGLSTRQSVRAETVSNVLENDESFLTQSVNDFIDNQGLLTVGPDTKVIPLGSRDVAGTTTEVNLGMRTLIHFDGISNVVVQRPDIRPTQSYDSASPTYAVGDNQLPPDTPPQYGQPLSYNEPVLLQPSYSSEYGRYPEIVPHSAYESTPDFNQESPESSAAGDRRPFRVVSSLVGGVPANRQNRPGVRVRVRPVSSRRVVAPSSAFGFYESTPVLPADVYDRQPIAENQGLPESDFASTPDLELYPNGQPITELPQDISDQFPNHAGRQASPPEEAGRPGGRRRLKITVRRPNNAQNATATNSRFVRPSRFEITTKPRIYVVTRTGPVGVVRPSKRPVSVKINRRPKPGEEDVEYDEPTSGVVSFDTYTTLTTVPVIFGLETSYRSVLLTTSSAVIGPEATPLFEGNHLDLQPTRAVVYTYFTTTTYTLPFTVGEQTLLTTLEETNSRIVTQTYDSEPQNVATTPVQFGPAITSYEFGYGGPTTHIINSAYDGTMTSTILYPGQDGNPRGTKVIRTDPNGAGFTSMYGAVPENIVPTSALNLRPQTLPPIQVYGPGYLDHVSSKPSYVTRVSEGVTLILASENDISPSSAVTLRPSVVTDAVHMKDKDPEFTVLFNTRTFYTTYTYFTTFFNGDSPVTSSSEQVVSNIVTVPVTQRIEMTTTPTPPLHREGQETVLTVLETSERLVTSTAKNTFTIYATLFNGSSSFVTPLEEVHTQVYTITEPYTLTKLITPTPSAYLPAASATVKPESYEVTSTLYTTYTNFVTLFQGTDTVISSIEETASNVATLTLFGSRPTELPKAPQSTSVTVPLYTTRTFLTTQTHYITLFSGDQTILSSIEEVATRVATEITEPTPAISQDFASTSFVNKPVVSSDNYFVNYGQASSSIAKEEPQLHTSLRTLYTTYTFYTTYLSDTATLISSREETSTSYVTLFVPQSAIAELPVTSSYNIEPTSSANLVTSTNLSTLTLYTTLFNGGEKIVISSEHVVPEVVTATVESSPQPTGTYETVHTQFTTYTFYDTYVSGTETLLTPSESIVTNYVTATATGPIPHVSSTADYSLQSPSIETRVETSVHSSVVVGSEYEIRTQIGDPATSSSDNNGASLVVVAGQSYDIDADIQNSDNSLLSGTSTTVIDGSTVIFFTDFMIPHQASTASSQSNIKTTTSVSVNTEKSSTADTTEPSTTTAETPTLPQEVVNSFSKAVTSTVIVSKSSEFVGLNKETTSLAPNATLLVITGTDGELTRLTHAASATPYADVIQPTEPFIEIPAASIPTTKPTIKPGSVIELSDLLGGNANLGGNIGEAIKGIVNLITSQQKNDTKEDHVMVEKDEPPLPPREGVTINRGEEPVYIPIGAFGRDKESQLKPIFKPIDTIAERTNERPDIPTIFPSYVPPSDTFSPGTLIKGFTPIPEDETASVGGSLSPTRASAHPVFDPSTKLEGSLDVPSGDSSSKKSTPAIQGTSVITGAKTIFLGGFGRPTTRASDHSTTKFTRRFTSRPFGIPVVTAPTVPATDSSPSATSRQNAAGYTTVTKDGQTIVSKTSSGATTIFYPLGNIPQDSTPALESSSSTKYVTRVESLTRTLTLTTTKIYYTRDSPITITSVFTTTIPPRTFVSTIVGSRTILGSFPEQTESVKIQPSIVVPSESTTTVTTTTKIFNDITTTVVRTLVIPTKPTKIGSEASVATEVRSEVELVEAGTERPPGPPQSADSTAINHGGSSPKFTFGQQQTTPRSPIIPNRRPVVLFKPGSRPVEATTAKPAFTGIKPRLAFPTRPPTTTAAPTTRRPPTLRPRFKPGGVHDQIQVCDPECDPAKKEVCRNGYNGFACECKIGYARKNGSRSCEEIQTYVVSLRVVKLGESAVSYRTQFSNSLSTEFQEFADMAKKGIAEAYKTSDVSDNYVDADVQSIDEVQDLDTSESESSGVLVKFRVQVSKDPLVGQSQLKEELSRSLKQFNFSVGGTELFVSPQKQSVENVQDFDECADDYFNDCSGSAICENLQGTYNCSCKENFQDMDRSAPGRVCSGEIKNCDYCNGRGDCLISEDSKKTCKCQRMYIGRKCEINGLVLAIALPLAAGLVIFLVCCLFCCCRRYRRHKSARNNKANVFKGLVNPLTGTLDKKAMIMDTSSESSGDHQVRPPPPPPPPAHNTPPHHHFDGFSESDMTPKKSSKKSELSLDRSLSTGFSVPPVMIPRARHQHPKQVNYPNMYGGQAFLQW